MEWEPRKMLGKLNDNKIDLADIKFSAHTNRVAVIDGHTVCASVELAKPVDPEVAEAILRDYRCPAVSEGTAIVTATSHRGQKMKRTVLSQDSTD